MILDACRLGDHRFCHGQDGGEYPTYCYCSCHGDNPDIGALREKTRSRRQERFVHQLTPDDIVDFFKCFFGALDRAEAEREDRLERDWLHGKIR